MTLDVSMAERIPGWMSRRGLEWLAATATSCTRIVEIGSWKGRSTKALARHTAGLVYAVDHWSGSAGDDEETAAEISARGADALFEEFSMNLEPELRANKVIPIRAESSEAVAVLRGRLAGGHVDLVFIDGDHSYDAVKRDIQNYLPFVRHGGLLAGHDYRLAFLGVVDAVEELLTQRSLIPGSAIWCARV